MKAIGRSRIKSDRPFWFLMSDRISPLQILIPNPYGK